MLRDLYHAAHTPETDDPLVSALLHADRPAVDARPPPILRRSNVFDDEQPALVAQAAAAGRWDAVRMLIELDFDVNA